jgi:hypothetical protein
MSTCSQGVFNQFYLIQYKFLIKRQKSQVNPVPTGLLEATGLTGTGCTRSGCSPSTLGIGWDWLWLLVAHFGVEKPDLKILALGVLFIFH